MRIFVRCGVHAAAIGCRLIRSKNNKSSESENEREIGAVLTLVEAADDIRKNIYIDEIIKVGRCLSQL